MTSAALEALGYSQNERVLIIHADDIGMCHASVVAFEELSQIGIVSSSSVMVPCPWFPRVAAFCRQNPHVDMGVHLTLTSEWRAYRWAPISNGGRTSELVDAAGYFFREPAALFRSASATAIAAEIRAQIDRAIAVGIDVTHIDSHMFAALFPFALRAYVDSAAKYDLPCLIWPVEGHPFSFAPEDITHIRSVTLADNANGLIPIDRVLAFHYRDPANALAEVRRAIDSLPPGLTHYLIHPAIDTPELRDITPGWRDRVADYEVFRNPALSSYLEQSGVRVIGYRALRTALRKRLAAV
jgi:predicted glycoside hydrolase/deacetylase ChbG (UPF0249 family)